MIAVVSVFEVFLRVRVCPRTRRCIYESETAADPHSLGFHGRTKLI